MFSLDQILNKPKEKEKKFGFKKVLSQPKFWSRKNYGPRTNLWSPKHLGPKKDLGEKFGRKKCALTKNLKFKNSTLQLKKFWVQRKLLVKKKKLRVDVFADS